MKDLDAATQLVHAGRDWDPEWGCVNPPVVRASTVLHKSCEDMMDRVHDEMACRDGKPCYGSYGGPAHKAFYSAMKTLEGPNAAGAWAFSTGLAATTTPLFAFVRAGCHALFSDSIYGPTREFAEQILRTMGVDVEFFDPAASPEAIEAMMRPETTLLMMENPGSHSFEMSDVPGIAAACRGHGVTSVIDNTWATPLYFKPLDHGVDMVVHAATKYIAGHSDLLMRRRLQRARLARRLPYSREARSGGFARRRLPGLQGTAYDGRACRTCGKVRRTDRALAARAPRGRDRQVACARV